MAHFSYRLVRHSSAAPEVLFDLLTDAPNWPTWTKLVPSARWEDPEVTGPGAVRVMGSGRMAAREQVVAEERPHRHEYAMPGTTFPARNYRAVVTFTPQAVGGTEVIWEGTFDATPGVGHAYLLLLRKAILGRISTDLVRAGDRA